MASRNLHFLSLLILFSLYTATAGDLPPIHDFFAEYGLPKGLLPGSVVNYSLSESNEFVVELSSPCYVMLTELVYYSKIIKGKLSYGAVTEASGVQAKVLFVWISITGFAVSPDQKYVEFQSGVLTKRLPMSMFDEIPVCKKRPPYLAEV